MASGGDGGSAGLLGTLFDSGSAIGRDDGDLVDRFLSGRGEVAARAFEAIVARHGGMVLRVCRATLGDENDARDAFQATFLVLTRRAGSIRRRDRLASWLFGVARKVALRARADQARRRVRERRAAVAERVDSPRSVEPDDLAALHEEIARLPATYRDPLILCDLEGLTYEAAARQLDCPLGTLAARIKRARDQLRTRLTRRGVVVADFGLVGALHPSAPLAPSILRSAITTGTVPVSVAALAQRTIALMRIKTLALGIGLLGLTVGSVGVGVITLAGPQTPVPSTTPPPAARLEPPPQRSWVRTIPGGPTVELIGVAPQGGAPDSWRSPDGQPLAAPPFARSRMTIHPQDNQRAWKLALRVGNVDPGRISCRCSPLPSVGGFYQPTDAVGPIDQAIKDFGVVLPSEQRTLAIRFGVAFRPWRTFQTSDPAGSSTMGGSNVIFGKTRSDGDQTTLIVSHDILKDDVRLVAVDLQGIEHTPKRTQTGSVATISQLDAEFKLPLATIKEFRLQTRPFESVSFEAIPLPLAIP